MRLIRTPVLLMFVVILSMLMNACAIEPARKSTASDIKDIVVDNEVQQDFDRAVQSLNEREYDKAIALLNSVIEKEQRLPAPYINMAMAYRYKDDDKQAEEYLMKALDIDLAHPVANNELGLLYRKLGRFDDARKAYTNALTKNPDYLPVIKNLGILCDLYIRDLECALEQYEKYQEEVPEDESVQIWIADLKNRM
jgi:Tfp pilus assembly protein PilF